MLVRYAYRRSLRRSATALAAIGIAGGAPEAALAQDHPVKDISNQAQTLAGTLDDPVETIKPDGVELLDPPSAPKPDLLIVPIPLSNPALGTGLTVAAVLFYNPNRSSQPWITGLGGTYTSNKTWAAGAFHNMSLAKDRFRVLMIAGYGDAKLKFYGIGPAAGDRDEHIDIEDRGELALVQGQIRVLNHVYAGARLQYLNINSKAEIPHPDFPDLNLPPLELDSTLVEVGPAITYDSRDSSLNPRKGVLATATWMFGVKMLGGDFTHDKLQLAGNVYLPVTRDTVVAGRAAICGVSEGAPFYDLCMFGQSGDLRGYETGRYRDRASWAIQGELRQHLFGRFGAAAFVGIGGVAPNLGEIIDHSTLLPAGGVGLRYLASRKSNINLRLDFAVGKDSNALYFSIGEAF